MADPKRISIVGTSGSGKSTLAVRLQRVLGIPYHELDLINWRPGWHNRSRLEPEAMQADVATIVQGDAWIFAGNYTLVRPLIWPRLTHLIWLDLPRFTVMRQVIGRSLKRAINPEEVFPGCREDWRRMLEPEHPIRWAWDTLEKNRATYQELTSDPAWDGIVKFRCRSRADVEAAFSVLIAR